MKVKGIDLINACKVATMVTLGYYAHTFGFQTMRAYIYIALHGSYLTWWFIHQRLSPSWGPAVFGEDDIPLPVLAIVFIIVGPGYSLPGYFAFKSNVEPEPWVLMAAVMMYSWGSLINVAADFYKDGFKVASPGGLVTQGPYRLARHINWFGDWMRYGSFALVSGSPISLLILGYTIFFNFVSLSKRTKVQASRGGVAAEKYQQTTPAIIPWRLLF